MKQNTRSERFPIARQEHRSTWEAIKTWLQGLQRVQVADTSLPWGSGACTVAVEQSAVLCKPFSTGRLRGVD